MKIGNKLLLLAQTVLTQEGEYLEFEHFISEGDILRCRIKCVEDPSITLPPNAPPDNKSKLDVTFNKDTNWFELTFYNFNHPFGMSVNSANFAMTNDQRPIFISAHVTKLTGLYKVEFQISIGELL